MKPKERWLLASLALVGVVLSLGGIGFFVWRVVDNGLGWHPEQTARDYYLQMGRAYSQGFTAGFFLCFFLILLALAIAPRWRSRRRSRRAGEPSGYASLREP